VDEERGAAVLGEFDRAIEDLETYARDVPFDRFVTDRFALNAVLRAITVAAQCAIDLALMIVADRRLGTPPTYREAFDVLARARVIPAARAAPLGEWAGIRNVVVHLYTKLDLETLHRAYTARTAVLREFRAAAAKALAPPRAPPGGANEARERRSRYRKTRKPAGAKKTTTTTTTTTTTRGGKRRTAKGRKPRGA
jgi:uncharacterized protein YutE (UPF0331/DUF86 family)